VFGISAGQFAILVAVETLIDPGPHVAGHRAAGKPRIPAT
jgi:hypothetical protein